VGGSFCILIRFWVRTTRDETTENRVSGRDLSSIRGGAMGDMAIHNGRSPRMWASTIMP
jgi:hypothetical protein